MVITDARKFISDLSLIGQFFTFIIEAVIKLILWENNLQKKSKVMNDVAVWKLTLKIDAVIYNCLRWGFGISVLMLIVVVEWVCALYQSLQTSAKVGKQLQHDHVRNFVGHGAQNDLCCINFEVSVYCTLLIS